MQCHKGESDGAPREQEPVRTVAAERKEWGVNGANRARSIHVAGSQRGEQGQ